MAEIFAGDERGQVRRVTIEYGKLGGSAAPFNVQLYHALENAESITHFYCYLSGALALIGTSGSVFLLYNSSKSTVFSSKATVAGIDACLVPVDAEQHSEAEHVMHIAVLISNGEFLYFMVPITSPLASITPVVSVNLSSKKFPGVFACLRAHWSPSNMASSQFVTAGKDRPVQLWTWSQSNYSLLSCSFSSASDPLNHLNLKPSFTVYDLSIIHYPSSMLIVVGTSEKEIRVYDPRNKDGKPVTIKSVSFPIHRIHSIPSSHMLLYSDTRGSLEGIDLRKWRGMGKYHDFVGSITQICHHDKFVITSCLDRFIRLHNLHSRELVLKIYMTQRLSCLFLPSHDLPHNGAPQDEEANEIEDDTE
jgi:hypothetical protein